MEICRAYAQLHICRDDEAAMEWFCREHPELVRAQMGLDAERDTIEKMQASSSRGEAGPSGTINVPSDSDESFEA